MLRWTSSVDAVDAVDTPSLLLCFPVETLQFGPTNVCEFHLYLFHHLKTAQTSCRIQRSEEIAIRCLSRKSQSSGSQCLVLLPAKLFGLTHLTQVDIHLCEIRWELLAKCLWLALPVSFWCNIQSISLGHKDPSTGGNSAPFVLDATWNAWDERIWGLH